MAAKHGVDLTRVRGTGIGGRVRKRDLLAHLERGEAAHPGTEDGPAPERPLHIESPYEQAQAAGPAGEADANGDGGPAPGHREPMSQMRRRIAEHMRRSLDTSAHCTTVVEVDLSAVVAARAELKARMAERGAPLTYLSFVARAVVESLQRHPGLNASIHGDEIVHHADVNLGIAVALEPGLIVPVIHRAQQLSLEGLAARIGELAERARGGALEPDDVRGGTFTITNPGRFGAVLATPIINQPQVAILDLEAVVKRPVVLERDGGDAIAIRPMTNLCMSWDHRALDGVDAARFLGDVKRRLEVSQEDG
jgi:2-oxoglutarate dehydrogenase E2 component (dihydrolipoamide succinyltransferase)